MAAPVSGGACDGLVKYDGLGGVTVSGVLSVTAALKAAANLPIANYEEDNKHFLEGVNIDRSSFVFYTS